MVDAWQAIVGTLQGAYGAPVICWPATSAKFVRATADGALAEFERQILRLLADEPRTPAELSRVLPLSPIGVREHLHKLRRRGLVLRDRGGWHSTL